MKAAVAIPTQRRAALPGGRARLDRPAGARRGRRGARRRRRARRGDPRGRRAPRRALPRPRRAARPQRRAQHRAARPPTRRCVCFVDDDVEVRPGWLDALLAAAAACPDEVAVLTGPIHARFEDHRFRTCGREGPPVTFLDLGPADRDCDHAWGANMAVRRSAVERAGAFDETRELYGDEQEWQARVKAAGGRHPLRRGRRARPPPRRRRRAPARAVPRRLPPRPGQPPLRRLQGHRRRRWRAELRVLAGCALHGPRRACMNGPVLTAHSLGRLRAALAAHRPPPADRRRTSCRAPAARSAASAARCCARRDAWLDLREAPRRARLRRAARRQPPRAPRARRGHRARRDSLMAAARAELVRSRHAVDVVTAPQGERGKFENLNALLAAHPPAAYDWLLVIDDDVALPRGFLDAFLCAAERTGLKLAQPAHRLHSHAAWPVTRRQPGATARETTFVEIGPVTAFHRDSFDVLLPFPEGLRMGWGLDVHWARAWRASTAGRSASSTRRRSATRSGRRAAATRATRPRRRRAPSSRERPTCAATRCARWRCTGEGRRSSASSTRAPTTPCWASGLTARRWRRATRAPTCACSCCTARCPPRATRLRDAPRRAAHAGRASRGTSRSTGSTCATCRSSPRRARAPTGRWGAWAAPTLAGALRRLRAEFPYDLVHAHNAVPAADAVLRARGAARRSSSRCTAATSTTPRRATPAGARAVRRALGARAARAGQLGGHRGRGAAPRRARARASCAWAPTSPTTRRTRRAAPDARHRRAPRRAQAPRRRAARAVAAARAPPAAALPGHRRRARARAAGAAGRRARAWPTASSSPASSRTRRRCARARAAHVFVMPSVDEAFGVAYVEAMAAGLPAIGARGEPGPQEIAAAGEGMRLVPPGDVEALAAELDALLAEPACAQELGAARARDRRARASRGSAAGARRSRPTRTRCDDAAPVLFVTNHVPPDRAGAFRALHEREGARARRSSAGARTTPRPGSTTPACRHRRVGPARGPRAGRQRPLRGGRRAGPRAASRCPRPSSAPGARASPFVLWSALWGDLTHPGAPRRAPAAAPHLPRRRRGRRPTARTSPPTPGARGARASPSPRRRSTTRSGRAPVAHRRGARRSRRCSSAATCPRRAWRCCARPGARRLVLAGGPPRAWSAPDAVVGARAGPQLLRRRRRSGHTFDRHPPLPASRGGSSPTKP